MLGENGPPKKSSSEPSMVFCGASVKLFFFVLDIKDSH
jgi:hypothetical protein